MKSNFPRAEDIYLFHTGKLCKSYNMMGAHVTQKNKTQGVRFTVWAPHAKAVSVVGNFNCWNGNAHPMKKLENSNLWQIFIPELGEGELYKYHITTQQGQITYKADPYAFFSEHRPKSASIVCDLSTYQWRDQLWWQKQKKNAVYEEPMLIYEVHLGSWKHKENGAFLTYRDFAEELLDYVVEMGYTHIQLLPVCEYPYDGSWGYQVTGFFAVTSRYGTPQDFMYLIDRCHQRGIGVILDWVPAHFCKDEHGLISFDGTNLYEKEEMGGWGTMKFDFSKPEVRSFLISNAIFWLDMFHIDGLRVDAVSSMLYLDYDKKPGEWTPNKYGGNGDLEAIDFLKQLNETVFAHFPNALMIAEESTAWPLVTAPAHSGGLGFNYKWNMGWMNDVLNYMEIDPYFRKGSHKLLTFSFMYAFSENFILPISHDEVVHGKKSLIEKMPGDYWQKFANLRVFWAYTLTHPGKKLLFMGQDFAQFIEWRFNEELEWFLLKFPMHRKFHNYVKELNLFYKQEKALWEIDHGWEGYQWIDCHNAEQSIISFFRKGKNKGDIIIVLCNFTPQCYDKYRIGVPLLCSYQEVFNSDLEKYGGTDKKNKKILKAEPVPYHNQPYSVVIKVPSLSAVLLKPKIRYRKNKGSVNTL